jgi:tryptophanyl-tRNA synthetase
LKIKKYIKIIQILMENNTEKITDKVADKVADKVVDKKVILSGIQSSGVLTIGHLTGALENWRKLQEDFDSYFMVADLHAITVKQVPSELRSRTLDVIAFFVACGLDPEKNTMFLQSHVPEHAELAWVLNCYTGMGELGRMTQFKDKSARHNENINTGLFSYPVLMASDILLYQANLVPVGDDQRQHLELTRVLAQRFNHLYSETFTIPEAYIPKIGSRIMSLQDPTKKMSKSDENQNSIIFLTDTNDIIIKKIKRSVTDSDNFIKFSEDKQGISNLMTLYQVATGKNIPEIEKEFEGLGYGDFKQAVGEAVAGYIAPIRDKFLEIKKDKENINKILKMGQEKARYKASKTLRKVYKKVGFYSFDK